MSKKSRHQQWTRKVYTKSNVSQSVFLAFSVLNGIRDQWWTRLHLLFIFKGLIFIYIMGFEWINNSLLALHQLSFAFLIYSIRTDMCKLVLLEGEYMDVFFETHNIRSPNSQYLPYEAKLLSLCDQYPMKYIRKSNALLIPHVGNSPDFVLLLPPSLHYLFFCWCIVTHFGEI